MNVGDREHLEKLLETHRRRLNVLEEQIAFFGVGYAPPHLLIERQDLQKAISEIQAQLREVLPDQARDLPSSSTRSIDQRTIRDTLEPIPSATNFIGRTSDLAVYRGKLHRNRLIIIKGMSGVGKTTLGAKLA